MGFNDLRLKLKGFKLRPFLAKIGKKKQREEETEKRPSWRNPVLHGYHVVNRDLSIRGGSNESVSDSVVADRQLTEDAELWFFGVFDPRVANTITNYIQSHLMSLKPNASLARRKAKEVIQKAHLAGRAKMRETLRDSEVYRVGSACALLINGSKLVMANMGDCRVIVCRNGVAHDLTCKMSTEGLHWTAKLLHEVRCIILTNSPSPERRDLAVKIETIEEDSEFVILASSGVWEAMSSQDAVNLIRRVEDPEAAAQCLTKEAVNKRSRSNIACLVIRFDQDFRSLTRPTATN